MLIANESVNLILRSSSGIALCKLDLEKAYDHVDRSFLRTILAKMGFGPKWCISTTCFSVIVNGTPHDFFKQLKRPYTRRTFFTLFICDHDEDPYLND